MIRKAIRGGFVEMLSALQPDYCLTLNLNRDFGHLKPDARRRKAEGYFKKFCQRLDRETLGSRYFKHQGQRAIIIVAPEHVESNYHYHGHLKFMGVRRIQIVEAREVVLRCWRKAIPSGTAFVEIAQNKNGWGQYLSKECGRKDWFEDVLMSSLYWPS